MVHGQSSKASVREDGFVEADVCLLVMVMVVSWAAVYVTFKCTNVVADFITKLANNPMIFFEARPIIAYRTVGGEWSGNDGSPVRAQLSPGTHGAKDDRSGRQYLNELHCE